MRCLVIPDDRQWGAECLGASERLSWWGTEMGGAWGEGFVNATPHTYTHTKAATIGPFLRVNRRLYELC